VIIPAERRGPAAQLGQRARRPVLRRGHRTERKPARLLTVIPLADALALPVCSLRTNVVVVPAFHGGLLGNGSVLPVVSAFLAGRPVTGQVEGKLRDAAEVISSVATAWRMPVAHPACPG
jgi:hypothetical protein